MATSHDGPPPSVPGPIVAGECATDDILVEFDAEGIRDLLGDLAAAEAGVALFQQPRRSTLVRDTWVRGDRIAWSCRQPIFALDQSSMEAQESRGLQDHGDSAQASGRPQERAESQNHSIARGSN